MSSEVFAASAYGVFIGVEGRPPFDSGKSEVLYTESSTLFAVGRLPGFFG